MTRADPTWPPGSVREILDSDLVTAPTAAALKARLLPVPGFSAVLDPEEHALLVAVCDRLVPQPDRSPPIDLAAIIHAKLAADAGNGWRYAVLPPDTAAMAQGLRGVDASARAMFGGGFADLAPQQADAVLAAVQRGDTASTGPDPKIFFEELLAGVAEAYYSHPLAQEEIGYVGMADASGWDTGFGARAAHEPVAS